jgi:spore germination protein YaaH
MQRHDRPRFRCPPNLIVAILAAVLAVTGCGTAGPPASAPPATATAAVSTIAGSGSPGGASPSGTPESASTSALPSVAPPPASDPGASGASHDPAKFGFLAKGMSHEVMAFVTTGQLPYAINTLDLDVISTIAFFSLEAAANGHIRHDGRWTRWNSPIVDQLITLAHSKGTKVVISLARFAWSPGQTRTSRAILSHADRRLLLATEVAAEVARRGVDGVNIDFEPIPRGQKANFTDFVRQTRVALDAIRPGYQLTFDVTGHYESYDVGGALRAGGADAVYLMGYHYAGTWSKIAGSTSPLGGPRYDVSDTIVRLLRSARPEQLIVGLPYYGHVWPTASSGVHARTIGGGHDVQYRQATAVAARLGARWDAVEQTRWVLFRDRACASCRVSWFQLYFDDGRSMAAKYALIKRRDLLGTGIWTSAFEGGRREMTAALHDAFGGPVSH